MHALISARRWTAACLLLTGVCLLNVVDAEAANNAATRERVAEDIRYLASEKLEGRAPGSEGLQRAAEYVRDEFQRVGLKGGGADGSFFQPFDIELDTEVIKDKSSLVLRGPDGEERRLELGAHFHPLAIGGSGEAQGELLFAGYGISAADLKYDDFAGVDAKGKILAIIRREPQQGDEKSVFDGKKVTEHSYIRTKLNLAKKVGAAGVLFVNDPVSITEKNPDQLVAPSGFGTSAMGIPFAHLKQSVLNELLAASPVKAGDKTLTTVEAIEEHIDTTFQPLTQPLDGWTASVASAFRTVKTEVVNVVGVLEGDGPHADETVILGAHYDHLGFGPFGSRRPNERALHPGADDNASGTSAVIELARRFAERPERPARRIVFIAFTAEERGLIGSRHYVEHPLFPLEKTVAMLNFDMIGQMREQKLIINGAKSGKELGEILETANEDESLSINVGNAMASGDHYVFYQKQIPAVHFFTGITKQYHTPDDTFESINVAGVVQAIDYCERVLATIAERPERLTFQKVAQPRRRGGGSMAYLGVVPDYAGKGDGLEVTEVNDDSPAAKGGLKAGDLIVHFGDFEVRDIQGLADGLRKHKAGEKVKVTVKRGDKKIDLEIVLEPPRGGR